jgi:hypothetical protein
MKAAVDAQLLCRMSSSTLTRKARRPWCPCRCVVCASLSSRPLAPPLSCHAATTTPARTAGDSSYLRSWRKDTQRTFSVWLRAATCWCLSQRRRRCSLKKGAQHGLAATQCSWFLVCALPAASLSSSCTPANCSSVGCMQCCVLHHPEWLCTLCMLPACLHSQSRIAQRCHRLRVQWDCLFAAMTGCKGRSCARTSIATLTSSGAHAPTATSASRSLTRSATIACLRVPSTAAPSLCTAPAATPSAGAAWRRHTSQHRAIRCAAACMLNMALQCADVPGWDAHGFVADALPPEHTSAVVLHGPLQPPMALRVQVRSWRKLIDSEQLHQNHESEQWLECHTQPCPTCTTKVQRNGGCNHIICTVCGQHFCYVCGKDWCALYERCAELRASPDGKRFLGACVCVCAGHCMARSPVGSTRARWTAAQRQSRRTSRRLCMACRQ